jgi:hypothetical protein
LPDNPKPTKLIIHFITCFHQLTVGYKMFLGEFFTYSTPQTIGISTGVRIKRLRTLTIVNIGLKQLKKVENKSLFWDVITDQNPVSIANR